MTNTETATRTEIVGIMALKAGDVVAMHGPVRTVESIRHGWSGNSRNAQRSIRVRYTDGTGSVFTSTLTQAERHVTR